MLIHFDSNHLLAIENENIPKLKEYTYATSGYTFSSFDKGMIVLHKKEFKIINLKNLGDNMSVVYIQNTKQDVLNVSSSNNAATIFQGFDEVTWKKYFFCPWIKEGELASLNQKLQAIGKSWSLQKTDKGICIQGNVEPDTDSSLPNVIQTLFDLVLLYGKIENKKEDLLALKIQLPLFGQYLNYQEKLDTMIQSLQEKGYFFKSDKLMNDNGMIYQISCNDYEILELFAKWYEPIAKFQEISKSSFVKEMKEKLLTFLESNEDIPSEGKQEVIEAINTRKIKLLQK